MTINDYNGDFFEIIKIFWKKTVVMVADFVKTLKQLSCTLDNSEV